MSHSERHHFEEEFEEAYEEQEHTKDETDPFAYLTEMMRQLALSQKALMDTLEKQERKP